MEQAWPSPGDFSMGAGVYLWRPHRRRGFRRTVVSREVAPSDAAVVTVGALQAGTKENVIPDEAVIKLNVRTFDESVRRRVLGAIERIVNAESEASGAPKPLEITPLDRYDLVRNDDQATERVRDALRAHFGDQRVTDTDRLPPARTSAPSGPSGMRRRCSGLSAGSTPTPTRTPSARAGSANCPPTTTRSSRRSSTRRSAPRSAS